MKTIFNLDTKNLVNIEMEKFLLSSMLLDNGSIVPKIAAILTANDFYRPEHRIIFSDILKVHALKQPVNLLTVIEFMRTNGNLDKIGISTVFALSEAANTTAYSESYALKLKEKSKLRQIQSAAEKIIADVNSGTAAPLDIIANANNSFNNINQDNNEDFQHIAGCLADFLIYSENNQYLTERKTGFENIDAVQLFDPGLYILGATPACGKTTFAWQLLEQMAILGEPCLFCSYEMSKNELATKTFARNLFLHDRFTSLTNSAIRQGGWTHYLKTINDIIFNAEEVPNFFVKEFSYENVDKLLTFIRPVIQSFDKPPVVCIDYLQRLIPRDHKSADTRALIDDALFKLKDFSNDTKTTFVVISTFNRTNYNLPLSFECFKESGGIEYTADVIWAMQLYVTSKLSGEKEGTIRDKIKAAKKQQPRQIQFSCLKNRKGNDYDCYFNYYSAHDYFEPCDEADFDIQGPPEKISDSDNKSTNSFSDLH